MKFSLFLIGLLFSAPIIAQTHPAKVRSILVCGDTKVHLVDPARSNGETPHLLWTWDARQVEDLPEQYRQRFFNSVDDVKPVRDATQLLISSSSGGIVLWDLASNKSLFHAYVPNAHSIELLPDGLIVAAASTHEKGNRLMLFDPTSGNEPVATDELYSAHGVVWHAERQTLFALGYDVLREYRVDQHQLKRLREWKIPGESGHDLTLSPDGKRFFLTEHTGVWQFDLSNETFSAVPNFPGTENVKSFNLAVNGQQLYTVPEERWWTRHVTLDHPRQRLAFPDLKVYKARWYRE